MGVLLLLFSLVSVALGPAQASKTVCAEPKPYHCHELPFDPSLAAEPAEPLDPPDECGGEGNDVVVPAAGAGRDELACITYEEHKRLAALTERAEQAAAQPIVGDEPTAEPEPTYTPWIEDLGADELEAESAAKRSIVGSPTWMWIGAGVGLAALGIWRLAAKGPGTRG